MTRETVGDEVRSGDLTVEGNVSLTGQVKIEPQAGDYFVVRQSPRFTELAEITSSSVVDAGNGMQFHSGALNNVPNTVLKFSSGGTTERYAMGFYHSATGPTDGTVAGSISFSSTATSYNTTSDYRLKENVTPLTGALARIAALPVHRFNFIAEPGKAVDGFLAHEAAAVVPESVTGEKDAVDENGDPVYQGIDQSKLVPLLVAAVQELSAKVAALEAAAAV